MRTVRHRLGADREDGNITLLTIGVLTLALALVLTLAAATQVHLARKRLYDAADELALSAADDLDLASYYDRVDEGGSAAVTLTDAGVAASVARHASADPAALHGLHGVRVVSAGTPDGRTAEVVLQVTVRPGPLTWVTAGLSHGVTITADSRARADS